MASKDSGSNEIPRELAQIVAGWRLRPFGLELHADGIHAGRVTETVYSSDTGEGVEDAPARLEELGELAEDDVGEWGGVGPLELGVGEQAARRVVRPHRSTRPSFSSGSNSSKNWSMGRFPQTRRTTEMASSQASAGLIGSGGPGRPHASRSSFTSSWWSGRPCEHTSMSRIGITVDQCHRMTVSSGTSMKP